jgi:hypothetical protein
MNLPDHERLRQQLESAASRARADEPGRRLSVAGRNTLVGLLVAAPVAAVVLAAIGTAEPDPRAPDRPVAPAGTAPDETSVAPSAPRRTAPRPRSGPGP